MKISIIIPTLNRPNQLLDLIQRLNSVVKIEEVIVVDDSVSSQEKELKEKAEFNLVYINRGKPLGVSFARNIGAKHATGDYLIFFDDDDDFSEDWLVDFRLSLRDKPDFIQCELKLIYSNRKEELISFDSQHWKLVIPGAWMIKKSVFNQIGGFDERLKYAENTELFLRLNLTNPVNQRIMKANLIYNQSLDGGSKNIQNMTDSLLLILQKHQSNLSPHTKHLYNQVIGVNQIRFRRFSEARKHLWKAYTLKPFKLSTLGRFIIALFPALAKKLYSKELKTQ